jgi:Ca2+-binding RTX toxin-like protein
MPTYVSNADITRTTASTHGWSLSNGDTLLVGPEAMIAVSGATSNGINGAGNTTVMLQGDIIATQHGISLGGSSEARIGADASVAAVEDGLRMTGLGTEATNAGSILAGGVGVNFVDAGGAVGVVLNNAGDISGQVGVRATGLLTLVNTGSIEGTGDINAGGATFTGAIEASGGADITNHGSIVHSYGFGIVAGGNGGAVSLVNTGLIETTDNRSAVMLGGGNDSVVNDGNIVGRVELGGGNDLYDGAQGRTVGTIEGEDGNDTILGGAGAEEIDAGAGDDEVEGGAGRDVIQGNAGNDTIDAGDGNDIVDGGHGLDLLEGGAGFDILSYAPSFGAVEVNLTTGEGAGGIAEGDVSSGFEGVRGSLHNDTLVGSANADLLVGFGGDDQLTGGGGNDRLLGQDGIDTLWGGVGADILRGGAGADIFRFNATTESTLAGKGRDRIADFNHAEADQIHLSTIDANTGLAGNQAFTFVGTAAFSNVAGELRYDAGPMATMVYGDTNGDGAADFAIQLTGNVALVAGDFVL